MVDYLTLDDIDDKYKSKLYTQSYMPKVVLDGVKVIDLKHFVADEGDFSEVIRINENGELDNVSGFKIAQINRTQLFPGSIKAWHIHFQQDEIWYLSPNFQLFVGLWDLRKTSPTAGKTMRVILGGGHSRLLFIPKGIAHGSANFSSENLNLYYFVNKRFNSQEPDERRIPWDTLGKEFWTPEKD